LTIYYIEGNKGRFPERKYKGGSKMGAEDSAAAGPITIDAAPKKYQKYLKAGDEAGYAQKEPKSNNGRVDRLVEAEVAGIEYYKEVASYNKEHGSRERRAFFTYLNSHGFNSPNLTKIEKATEGLPKVDPRYEIAQKNMEFFMKWLNGDSCHQRRSAEYYFKLVLKDDITAEKRLKIEKALSDYHKRIPKELCF
jgi:hypothetical protein